MKPETEADAPMTGARSNGLATYCAAAPASAVTAKNRRNRAIPKRRATGVPNASSQTAFEPDVGPPAVQQRVGDGRPRLRRAVAEEEPARLRLAVAGLSLARERHQRIDDALRRDHEGDPARHEGEPREERVVPGVRDHLPDELDPDQDHQD